MKKRNVQGRVIVSLEWPVPEVPSQLVVLAVEPFVAVKPPLPAPRGRGSKKAAKIEAGPGHTV